MSSNNLSTELQKRGGITMGKSRKKWLVFAGFLAVAMLFQYPSISAVYGEEQEVIEEQGSDTKEMEGSDTKEMEGSDTKEMEGSETKEMEGSAATEMEGSDTKEMEGSGDKGGIKRK